jgi:NAD(P)-dependent dehydrogenase (short-subunit alcohol dehydrogenase family)
LRAAAAQVAQLTGGSLDILINNAAYVSHLTTGKFLDEFEDDTAAAELDDDLQTAWTINVVGTIYCINAFLPLIKKGAVKKVLTISSGMGDLEFVNNLGIWESAPYSMSKAAVNIAVAKYGARYKDEGILFISMSPGVVDTGATKGKSSRILASDLPLTESCITAPGIEGLIAKFLKAAPNFPGPMAPVVSVEKMLKVTQSMNVQKGDSGAFVSEKGTNEFL